MENCIALKKKKKLNIKSNILLRLHYTFLFVKLRREIKSRKGLMSLLMWVVNIRSHFGGFKRSYFTTVTKTYYSY